LKSKFAILAIGALVLATATVSAAVLPAITAPRGPVTAATTWADLKVTRVAFPTNLDVDHEGVWVLKTTDQWNAFWASVPQPTDPSQPVGDIPYVDFTHQFAVVASYGWHDEGFAISVTHARFNGMAAYVEVDRQVQNPDNCRPHYDPFFGGVAIVEKPAVTNFASTQVGASYHQVLEPQWTYATRDC